MMENEQEIGEVFFENGKRRDKITQRSKASFIEPVNSKSRNRITIADENIDNLNVTMNENDTMIDTKKEFTDDDDDDDETMNNSCKVIQKTLEENVEADILNLKSRIFFQEDFDTLYENHIVKEELVIGPEVVQGVTSSKLIPATYTFEDNDQTFSEVESQRTNFYNCYSCVKVISYQSVQEKHLHKQACIRLYTCDYCKVNVDTRNKFVTHIKRHLIHGQRQFKKNHLNLKSKVGDKKLKSKRSLQQHMKSHRDFDKKDTMCEICGKNFSNANNARKHKRIIHDGWVPYNCKICGKSYKQKQDCINHENKVHSSMIAPSMAKQLPCKYCNKIFDDRSNCNRHEKYHCSMNKSKIYNALSCDICQKSYNYKSSLVSHMQMHFRANNTGTRKVYVCDICLKSYNRKRSLVSHMQTHFPVIMAGTKEVYTCNMCKKKYTRKSNLKCHMEKKHLHTTEHLEKKMKFTLKITCDNCKQPVPASYFSSHSKTCLLKRKCKFCNRTFKNIKKLTKHMKIHVGTKPIYECDTCQLVYSFKAALIDHIQIVHMNIRKFTCDTCESTFTRRIALNRHKRNNTCPLSKSNGHN